MSTTDRKLVGMKVAPYSPADRDGVVSLVLDIQRGEFGVPITLEDQPDLADIPAIYGHGRGAFLVAKDGEEVVGTIGLLDGGEVALRKMFVRSDHRGRERGVAARLLHELLHHARSHGVSRVFLGTRDDMHAAHRFYEKNGFRRIAAEELPAAFPRMSVDSVFYRLDL
jgi:GNAT superfamily N-acetyltransferase